MASRIDVHEHVLPPFYRDALRAAGITQADGRAGDHVAVFRSPRESR